MHSIFCTPKSKPEEILHPCLRGVAAGEELQSKCLIGLPPNSFSHWHRKEEVNEMVVIHQDCWRNQFGSTE